MAWRDSDGWLNFEFLGDGRVEDEKERDESRWEIILGNWDWRELCVQVNWPLLIRQVRVPIRRVITPIRGLPNPIRHAVHLMSHIRSYPPYLSPLHPPSLFLVHDCTIITRTQSWVIPLYLSMPWSRVNTEYRIHRAQHTPSTAYTEHSIHRVQHTPSTPSTQDWLSSLDAHNYELTPDWGFSLRRTSLHDRPPSASSPWELKGEVTLSRSHSCELTDWWIGCQHPARRPSIASKYSDNHAGSRPPSVSPNSLEYGLQVHISILVQWRPLGASPNLLDHGLQVYLQSRSGTASKCISKLTRSRSRSASLRSLDHGLQVYLQSHSITASKCKSPNSLDHGHEVHFSKLPQSRPQSASLSSLSHHFQAHLELISSTACGQSRYIVCGWVAI